MDEIEIRIKDLEERIKDLTIDNLNDELLALLYDNAHSLNCLDKIVEIINEVACCKPSTVGFFRREMGINYIGWLFIYVDSSIDEISIVAINALAKLNIESVIPILFAILRSDRDYYVRLAAMKAIGRLGNKTHLHDTISFFYDHEDGIGDAAIHAAYKINRRN